MVPHDFLSLDPPHRGPTKGTALFQVWCVRELAPMVVETWIEMLKETLKYISFLLRFDAFVVA
jgi:hypothetical protein